MTARTATRLPVHHALVDLHAAGLSGHHVAKIRPVVVLADHGDHVHAVPLTSRLRRLRLSQRLPGADRAPSLIPVVCETRLATPDVSPYAVLCAADSRRISELVTSGELRVARPRLCRPLPPTSPTVEVLVDRCEALLGPPPATVPADEALRTLLAA